MSVDDALALAAAAAVGFVGLTVLATMKFRDPSVQARRLLWVGALAPITITVPKAASEVESAVIGPIDVARGVVPAACLILALLISRGRAQRRDIGGVELALLGFLAFCLASALWSAGPLPTALKAGTLAVQYAILWELTRRYDSPRAALDGLLGVAHLLLLSVIATLVVAPQYALSGAVGDPVVRLHGVIPRLDANPLGTLAVLVMVAMLLRIGPRLTIENAALRTILWSVYLFELLATRTRTAAAIGAVLLLVATVYVIRRNAAVLVAAHVGLVSAVVLVQWRWDRIVDFLVRGQSTQALTTLTGRTDVWERASLAWAEERWDGHGFYYGHRTETLGFTDRQYANYDNTWIELLVDVGLIGAGLLALALLLALRRLWTDRHHMPADEFRFRLLGLGLGIATSIINPTFQQTAVTAVMIGFLMLLPPASARDEDTVDAGVQQVGRRPSLRQRQVHAVARRERLV